MIVHTRSTVTCTGSTNGNEREVIACLSVDVNSEMTAHLSFEKSASFSTQYGYLLHSRCQVAEPLTADDTMEAPSNPATFATGLTEDHPEAMASPCFARVRYK